jgi:RNA polymerase sigma-70 factor (ECF subfamily)
MLTRRTGDPARAEDLAQETFLRALEAPPTRPRPWLFAVALNLARDEGRRAVRQDRQLERYGAEQETMAPAADEALDRSDRRALVRAALERLTETDRGALLMQAEGLRYDEIASGLGLAVGAIGTTLSRARRRLVEAVRDLERGNDGRAR